VFAQFESLCVLCGFSSRTSRLKSFDFSAREQEPLTAKLAKESRKGREEFN
jgi:hypothetical protein